MWNTLGKYMLPPKYQSKCYLKFGHLLSRITRGALDQERRGYKKLCSPRNLRGGKRRGRGGYIHFFFKTVT